MTTEGEEKRINYNFITRIMRNRRQTSDVRLQPRGEGEE